MMKYWLPVLLWIGLIFLMSTQTFSANNTSLIVEPILRFLAPSISQSEINFMHFLIRKAGHVTEYFISGLLLHRAYRAGSSHEQDRWRWSLMALVTIVIIACADELHQSVVSVRTSSITDVGFDAAGGLLAQVVSIVFQYRNRSSG